MDDNTFENIVGYCGCKQGSRTARNCAHVIAALFYMIHRKQNRDLPSIHPKATELGSTLMDCLEYNKSKRQRDADESESKMNQPAKKRKTYRSRGRRKKH